MPNLRTQTGIHEKGTFSLEDAIRSIKSRRNFPKAGAIAIFVGVVRGETAKGDVVRKLTLEAYEEKASQVLNQICMDLKKKRGIVDVQIHHLLGEFTVGEDIVYVLVTGSHRKDTFPVLQEAVERYKREAPIFKKELITTEKGQAVSYWVEEQQPED